MSCRCLRASEGWWSHSPSTPAHRFALSERSSVTFVLSRPTKTRHASPSDSCTIAHPADDAAQHALSVDGRISTGFLRSRGVDAVQEDLALALVLRLFSPTGLAVRECIEALPKRKRMPASGVPSAVRPLPATIDARRGFLAGARPRRSRIASRAQFPARGTALQPSTSIVDPDGGDPLAWAFGALGVQDRARHFATLYLDDIADVLREAVDPRFEFVRYAESLRAEPAEFRPARRGAGGTANLVDQDLHELTLDGGGAPRADLVLVSAPFPGSVYGAFRIAQAIKAQSPDDRHRARRRLREHRVARA